MIALAFCLLWSGIADLEELARRKDIQWTVDAATGRHLIRAGSTTMAFAPGLQVAIVNNLPFSLSMPVTVEQGHVKLPPELARFVEMAPPRRATIQPSITKPGPAVERPEARSMPLRGATIAIDPGHGGIHTGGKGHTGLMEKEINLGVSLNLQRVLESWGARVIMTRTTDRHFDPQVDDDLDARVQIVNGKNPDLFLSIHTNYVANAAPRGFEVWVPRCAGQRNTESRDLADLLRGELGGVWGANQDRGTKDDHNLRVLRGTHCPAALVELEFVSNPSVERMLGQASKQRELGEAIAEAVRGWVQRHR